MAASLLQRIADAGGAVSVTRRRILEQILEDPERVLEESFELLAQRTGSSVPTVMRTCRALGFSGLREFKLALAQELALGGSPLHRRVNLDSTTEEVITHIVASATGSVLRLREQLDVPLLDAVASALAAAPHIDIFGAGATSWFMAGDLQARLFRLGLSVNVWSDYHFQQVAAGAQGDGSVVFAISHVGGMPTLLDAVDIAKAQGARVIAMTRAETPLAARADLLLAIDVPDDAVMRVGVDAYLAHLVAIEIISVLVAQRRGGSAVDRLQDVRSALQRHGIDIALYPIPAWSRNEQDEGAHLE